MTARLSAAAVILSAWIVLCAATPTPSPSVTPSVPSTPPALVLGDIVLGSSALDAEKRFGMPDVASTTDEGTFWQWSGRDGLDREVFTDEDLIVRCVLVAHPRGSSTAQPREAPMLGAHAKGASAIAAAAGAGPIVTQPRSQYALVWPLRGGYLVGETDGDVVDRVRILDSMYAQRWGYITRSSSFPPHTAASMVREVIKHPLPQGWGEDIVRVWIDARGNVTDAKVIVSSGQTEVDMWSLDCVRLSKFKPATCAGAPCAGTYIYSGGITH